MIQKHSLKATFVNYKLESLMNHLPDSNHTLMLRWKSIYICSNTTVQAGQRILSSPFPDRCFVLYCSVTKARNRWSESMVALSHGIKPCFLF
jgi:hypothetical protein